MSKRLLIVDDSVFIWEEMKNILKGSEFEVVGCAKTGEEALSLYEQVQPDVVTLDIILPGMDGIDTAKLLLEKWPEAKIIIVSSLAYDETMDEAKSAGARDFVFKPFDSRQIIEVLSRVAD